MKMMCHAKIWVNALAALMVGLQVQATIFVWDGGAGTDNWKDANNWNPNGTVVATNTVGAHRLNVDGTQISRYTAEQGTTVYTGDPTPSSGNNRGLVIGNGTNFKGYMRISGGSFSTLGSSNGDIVGNGSGAIATLIIDGGTFIGTTAGMNLGIGTGPTSSMIVSNGTATVAALTMYATTANLILAGGVLDANTITRSGGTCNLIFDGGTLRVRTNATTFLQGLISTKVESRGAVIDTNGKTNTITQNLLAGATTGGGLEKKGAGILTLTGNSTFTGTTTISEGILALGASASLNSGSSISIASGATFDVSSISSYTWGASAGLTASGTVSSVATIKGGTSVSLNGRPVTLSFVPTGFLGDSGHPALTMSAGSLDLTGSTVAVFNNAASPLGAGDYTVVSGGTVTGTAPTLDATSGVGNGVGMAANTSATFVIVSGNLILRVVSSLPAATTTLVLNAGFSSPSTYGDALQFDVTVTGATPTGDVILKTGGSTGTTIGSGTLVSGSVTITISPLNILAATTHANIVAVYLGDESNAGSVSSPLMQVVQSKALTIPDAVAQGKLYDATTAAVIAGTLSGVVSGDTVTLSGTGTFENVGPGTGISVTSTSTLGGASASNYTLTQPAGLAADILTSAVWTAAGGGLWNTPGNWQSGAIGLGSGKIAYFNTLDVTSDTTVNLDSTRMIGTLVFGDTDIGSAAGWTLANNSVPGNMLTLAGTTPTVTVNTLGTGKSATISAVVAGSDGLTKDGSGTLALSGANTYSGVTVISNGMVVAKNSAAFGATTDGTTVESGATLDLGNGLATDALNLGVEEFTIKGTGVGSNGALVNNGANTQINAIRKVSLGSNGSIGGISRWDVRGSGSALNLNGHTLTKVGANSVALVATAVTPGAGAIDVFQGTFSIQTTTTMGGSSANTLTVRNAAMLDLYQSGTWTAPTWSLILEGGSTLQSSLGTAIWAGPVTLNGNATFGGTAGLTVNGAITGVSGSLTKTGAGMLTLGSTPGANTYGGATTIAAGCTLALAASEQIPDASVMTFTAGTGTMYFSMLGNLETVAGISDTTTRGVIQNEYSGTGKPASVLTINAVNDSSFNGYIRNSYDGTTGPLGLTKTGAGKQTLSGTNIKYTGPTTVSEGTLVLADTTAFASDITDDALLELSIGTTWTLAKAITGAGQLIKSGAGVLSLSGANSYSGGTTIDAGKIVLSSAGAVGSSGIISMNGGTLQFSAANTSDYSGARLRLEDDKTATFDTAGQNVSFANALATGSAATAGLAKSGGGTLTLSAANTYKGLTTVAGGVLRIQHAEALGTTNAGVTVASGMRVELVGLTVSGEAITVNGTGGNYWGGLQSASGTSEWQGPVTIGSELTRIGVNTGTFTVSGVIDSGENVYGVMFRPDTGTLVLSATNSYLGDTAIVCGSGLVKLSGGANRLPVTTKLIFGASATSGLLDLNGQDQEVVGLSVNSGTANEIRSFAAPAILTINTTNGAPSTFSGKITQNVMLVKKGVESLTLSGANTYSNGTIVSDGTLRVASALVLPVTGAVTLAADGTLDLAGTSPVATPVTVGSLTSSGGLLKLSTLDRLQVTGNMAGTLRLRLSDPELLTHGVTYVVAQFVGTPPESVTLEGAAYPWAAKVVIGEIRIVKIGGTCVSFF